VHLLDVVVASMGLAKGEVSPTLELIYPNGMVVRNGRSPLTNIGLP